MKVCTKCNLEKDLSEFYFIKNTGKYKSTCKYCTSLINKKWREENQEYLKEWRKNNPDYDKEYRKERYRNNPDYDKEYSKEWRKNNPSYSKEYNKKWREENPEYNSIYSKEWREKNPEHVSNYKKNRSENDELFILTISIRKRIYQSFKCKSFRKNSKTSDILGCSFEEFKLHLESLFEDLRIG